MRFSTIVISTLLLCASVAAARGDELKAGDLLPLKHYVACKDPNDALKNIQLMTPMLKHAQISIDGSILEDKQARAGCVLIRFEAQTSFIFYSFVLPTETSRLVRYSIVAVYPTKEVYYDPMFFIVGEVAELADS